MIRLVLLMIFMFIFNITNSQCVLDKYEIACMAMVDDEYENDQFYKKVYLELQKDSVCYLDNVLYNKGYLRTDSSNLEIRNLNFVVTTYVNCQKLIILTKFKTDSDHFGIIIEAINPKSKEEYPNLLSICNFNQN